MTAEDILRSTPSPFIKGSGILDKGWALAAIKEAYRLGANVALDKADSETWVHSNSILLLKDTIILED